MVVAVEPERRLHDPCLIGANSAAPAVVPENDIAPPGSLFVDRDTLPVEFKRLLDDIDYRLAIAQWRDYQLSPIYNLQTIRNLKEGGSAAAVVWVRGAMEVMSIEDRVINAPDGCLPIHFDMNLRSKLLVIGGVDAFELSDSRVRKLLESLKGSVVRPPSGEKHKVAQQVWHNGRFLQSMHFLPEIRALLSGQMLYKTLLVNVNNGYAMRVSGLNYEGQVVDGLVGIRMRLTRRAKALFVKWEDLSPVSSMDPALMSYFGRNHEIFVQHPNTTIMPQFTPFHGVTPLLNPMPATSAVLC